MLQGPSINEFTGTAGKVLPQPLEFLVTDTFGNPVANTTLSFSIAAGGGLVNQTHSAQILSDALGSVSVTWRLGPR